MSTFRLQPVFQTATIWTRGMCLFLTLEGYHQEKINSGAALLSLSCLSNVCFEKKCFKLVMLFTLFFFKIPSTASPKSCPRGVIICDKKNFASATFELQKFFLAARRRLFKSRENFFYLWKTPEIYQIIWMKFQRYLEPVL